MRIKVEIAARKLERLSPFPGLQDSFISFLRIERVDHLETMEDDPLDRINRGLDQFLKRLFGPEYFRMLLPLEAPVPECVSWRLGRRG